MVRDSRMKHDYIPGSAATKEAETKKVEPVIAVITWPDETANKTTNNEIQSALATLSTSIQVISIRLDKIEVKPTVAIVTKTDNGPEKQQQWNRGQPKTKNFNATLQQTRTPINAYAYHCQQPQAPLIYNLTPPEQYITQYLPSFQQQPNN